MSIIQTNGVYKELRLWVMEGGNLGNDFGYSILGQLKLMERGPIRDELQRYTDVSLYICV